MTKKLSVDQVVEINRIECRKTGEPHQVRDLQGLEGAVERPWSGHVDGEFYPSLLSKAAALLHGITSKQVFVNGNKRTAWIASEALLNINGVDLGAVPAIVAESMVRAASTDQTFGAEDVLEWLQAVQQLSLETRGPGGYVNTPAGRFPQAAFVPTDPPMARAVFVGVTDDFELSFYRERIGPDDIASQQEVDRTHEKVAIVGLDLEGLDHVQHLVADILDDFRKVGRNDPCACQSGIKFKFCHGRPTSLT